MDQNASPTDFAPDTGPHDPVEYDKWFRAKVQESLDDPRPAIPHEQVMAQMEAIIQGAEARKLAREQTAGTASA